MTSRQADDPPDDVTFTVGVRRPDGQIVKYGLAGRNGVYDKAGGSTRQEAL